MLAVMASNEMQNIPYFKITYFGYTKGLYSKHIFICINGPLSPLNTFAFKYHKCLGAVT